MVRKATWIIYILDVVMKSKKIRLDKNFQKKKYIYIYAFEEDVKVGMRLTDQQVKQVEFA